MRKFKTFFDYKKEEKWLESMMAEGYKLNRTGIYYQFKKAEKQDVIIKSDYRILKTPSDYFDYVSLFEDAGWEHISGTRTSGYHYFMSNNKDTSTDIFNECDDSHIYNRYSPFISCWYLLLFSFLLNLLITTHSEIWSIDYFLHPSQWYYTPGLWEKTGISFLFRFLFETPFALGRSGAWLIPFIILSLFMAIKYTSLYFKTKSLVNQKKVK